MLIRTTVKTDSIIFERIIFNLVRKSGMTINGVVGSSELGGNNTDKIELLIRDCRLLNRF